TSQGQYAQIKIEQHLNLIWPNLKNQIVISLGYSQPWAKKLAERSEQFIAFWPLSYFNQNDDNDDKALEQLILQEKQSYINCVCEHDLLALEDMSVDKILLVHMLEHYAIDNHLLDELWRVLNGSGSMILIVPARRGLWARNEHTPFGHGLTFSKLQLQARASRHQFSVQSLERTLYSPPQLIKKYPNLSSRCDVAMQYLVPHLAGALISEWSKDIYATTPACIESKRNFKFKKILKAPNPA
ncbi:MAG: methyltransferase domain-containing protein, partial [Pseudomonadota bacterium]